MEIGEFSKNTGISIDTLRYYDKINLLVPKKIGSRRSYGLEEGEKAHIILKLKSLNFTLEEIKAILDLDRDTEEVGEAEAFNPETMNRISDCLELIKAKYEDIIRKEQEMIQTKGILKKMIDKANCLVDTGRIPDKTARQEGKQ